MTLPEAVTAYHLAGYALNQACEESANDALTPIEAQHAALRLQAVVQHVELELIRQQRLWETAHAAIPRFVTDWSDAR